jgi:predicted permease
LKFGGTLEKSIKKVVLFPSLWAVILGILLNLVNIPIGGVLENTVNYLGQGAIPLIMITLGLSIDFSAIRRSKSMIAFTSVMKLAFFPFIAFLFASQIGLLNLEHTISVVEAAMPSGMMSLLLAITYKLDNELTSDCILINTVISLITLPLIIVLL